MVILEDLVPAEHLLRKIDKYIDFEFIRDAVRHLYCDNNGRPAVDPVECSFADAKQLHGHRYTRYRGLRRVSEHCLLAAACQI